AGRDERRPEGRARAGTGARRARVLFEEVERATLRVDEDVAERGARHTDRRRRSRTGLRRLHRRGRGGATATATRREREPRERDDRTAGEEGTDRSQGLHDSFLWPRDYRANVLFR